VVQEIAPKDVARRLRSEPGRLLLLDVREDFEREVAAIEPSVHVPMQQVPERLREIPHDRTVVVYCHTGVRSAMVAGYLSTHGFEDVASLQGGIDRWSRDVDPKVPRYG
jgi:rhodanese-related sulfurtransferase